MFSFRVTNHELERFGLTALIWEAIALATEQPDNESASGLEGIADQEPVGT